MAERLDYTKRGSKRKNVGRRPGGDLSIPKVAPPPKLPRNISRRPIKLPPMVRIKSEP